MSFHNSVDFTLIWFDLCCFLIGAHLQNCNWQLSSLLECFFFPHRYELVSVTIDNLFEGNNSFVMYMIYSSILNYYFFIQNLFLYVLFTKIHKFLLEAKTVRIIKSKTYSLLLFQNFYKHIYENKQRHSFEQEKLNKDFSNIYF